MATEELRHGGNRVMRRRPSAAIVAVRDVLGTNVTSASTAVHDVPDYLGPRYHSQLLNRTVLVNKGEMAGGAISFITDPYST